MTLKKVRYNTGEEIAEITIKNHSGSILEKWIFMISDFLKVTNIIKKKYGIRMNSSERDLEWAL